MSKCPWPRGTLIRVKTLEQLNYNRDSELEPSFDGFNKEHAGKNCKVFFSSSSRECIKTLFYDTGVRWQRFELIGSQLRIKLLEELKV